MSSQETRPNRPPTSDAGHSLGALAYEAAHCVYSVLTRCVSDPLARQHVKLAGLVWGYWRLWGMRGLSVGQRLRLLRRFLRIDWNVVHGHSPSELAHIALAMDRQSDGRARNFVEAGCWQGGSSAKFSILCKLYGYRLHVFDSFEGVGDLTPADREKEWDYEGQYAAPEAILLGNLDRYGERSVVSTYRGWFSETLARGQASGEISVTYIDCDIAKGTWDALVGIVPALSRDAVVFSQDFHIEPVRTLLTSPASWAELGVTQPEVTRLGRRLAIIRFRGGAGARGQG